MSLACPQKHPYLEDNNSLLTIVTEIQSSIWFGAEAAGTGLGAAGTDSGLGTVGAGAGIGTLGAGAGNRHLKCRFLGQVPVIGTFTKVLHAPCTSFHR